MCVDEYSIETRKTEIVSLGTKDLLWYIELFFLTPFWLLRPEDRKPWVEFKNGLISHKCKYDLDKPIKPDDCNFYHFECLHTGCNIVDVDKSYCTKCGKVNFIPKRDENLKLIPELCVSCKYPI